MCFAFLVKCAEASFLWRLVFMVFPCISVTLDTDIAILGVQNLSVGRLGASNVPPWGPLCQLGDTLETMGAAGRTRGSPEPDS